MMGSDHLTPPTTPRVVLLGPQRLAPTVDRAADALGVDGPIALITAGWQEREGEDEELRAALGRPTVNLALHARAEAVFAEDPALFAQNRALQDRLIRLQELYRRRLPHAMADARQLLREQARIRRAAERDGGAGRDGGDAARGARLPELVTPHLESALAGVRRLDSEHAGYVHDHVTAFARSVMDDGEGAHPALARHRAELAAVLAGAGAVAIAGGHVAVLSSRIRLFGLADAIARLPIMAWSAGAMLVTESIALFHDAPPFGRGDAEVLGSGLGVVPGVVVLPHARRRLALARAERVALLARRFSPARCVPLDEGDGVMWDREAGLAPWPGARTLTADGACEPWGPPREPASGAEVGEPGGAPDSLPGGLSEALVDVAAGGPVAAEERAPDGRLAALLAALRTGGAIDEREADAVLHERELPLVDGARVMFVWRGEADAVRLRHWVYGLPSAQPFHRVPGTRLWHFELELPRDSRIEYKLEIERGGHTEWIRDPGNPHLAHDPFGGNSVCQGEGYVRPAWTLRDPESRPGALSDITITGTPLGDRRVTLYLPARFRTTRRYPLLIVHDGGDYLRYAALGTVLDNLIHELEVEPMIVALTHPGQRLDEYPDNPAHAAFVVEHLLPELERLFPLRHGPGARGLMGASFGGVASLSTAWRHPGVFGRLLLQSGSFAFTDIGEHQRGPAFDRVVEFVNAFRTAPGRPSDRVFVSCGTYESLIYENRSIVPLLQASGMTVRYVEARDGHNWENWRDRLREALAWLFPGPLWLVYE